MVWSLRMSTYWTASQEVDKKDQRREMTSDAERFRAKQI